MKRKKNIFFSPHANIQPPSLPHQDTTIELDDGVFSSHSNEKKRAKIKNMIKIRLATQTTMDRTNFECILPLVKHKNMESKNVKHETQRGEKSVIHTMLSRATEQSYWDQTLEIENDMILHRNSAVRLCGSGKKK